MILLFLQLISKFFQFLAFQTSIFETTFMFYNVKDELPQVDMKINWGKKDMKERKLRVTSSMPCSLT